MPVKSSSSRLEAALYGRRVRTSTNVVVPSITPATQQRCAQHVLVKHEVRVRQRRRTPPQPRYTPFACLSGVQDNGELAGDMAFPAFGDTNGCIMGNDTAWESEIKYMVRTGADCVDLGQTRSNPYFA